MVPIAEFTEMVESRTQREITTVRLRSTRLVVAALAIVLLSLSLVGASVFIVHRRVEQPVSSLVLAARAVERGDYSERVTVRSQDEIGQLAGTFNHMTDAIEADIAERKQAEQAMKEAREAADAANRAKSDFLANMSHELRTPLNGVLGYAQILQRDPDATRDQKESLDSIVNCGTHLLSLINDVLDLSKIEAGRLEIDEAATAISASFSRTWATSSNKRVRAKGLEFETEASPEVPQGIVTDAGKLRQVLVNLLGNAVKFTEEGGVALRVSEVPKGRLAIRGRGHRHRNERGGTRRDLRSFQAGGSGENGRRNRPGAGDLAAHRRRMGGAIDVESETGKGSTFTVSLPLVEADTEDLGSLEAENGKLDYGATVLAPGQQCTVLVADDRKTNRDILKRMLDASGFVRWSPTTATRRWSCCGRTTRSTSSSWTCACRA